MFQGQVVFQGRVLNRPQKLQSIYQGSEVKFIIAHGTEFIAREKEFPVMVTDKYLRERAGWSIKPCSNCGFTELFDAPSDLLRASFPGSSGMNFMTSLCPLCRSGSLHLFSDPEFSGEPAFRTF